MTESRSRRMISGALVLSGGAIIQRVITAAGQLVLARLLAPAEFGLFASLLIVHSVVSSTRAASRPVVVAELAGPQGSSSIPRRLVALTAVYSGCLALAAVVMWLTGAAGSTATIVVVAFAVAMPLHMGALESIAALAARHDFASAALVPAVASGVRIVASIVLAIAGFGAAGLALAMVVESIVELGFARQRSTRSSAMPLSPGVEPSPAAGPGAALGVGSTAVAWLVFAGLFGAAAVAGDYFVASWFEDIAIVGLYYFAFQLTSAVLTPLGTAVMTALVPSLTVSKSPERDVLVSTEALGLTAAPAGLGIAVLFPLIVDWVWGSRWSDAAVPVAILALSLPFRVLLTPFLALMNSKFEARQYSLFLATRGIVTVVAAAIGAVIGAATAIAASVAIGHTLLVGVTIAALVSRLDGFDVRSMPAAFAGFVPTVCGGAVLGIAALLGLPFVGAVIMSLTVTAAATFAFVAYAKTPAAGVLRSAATRRR